MSSSRWDPWGDIVSLREAMSNLFEESFVRSRAGAASVGLAVDLRETTDAYVLSASVPGVHPDDVTINVLGDALSISGERREERDDPGGPETGRWLIRERRFGAFQRTVSLPMPVKADEATADFKDGVLTVMLPKAEEAKPKTIRITARSGAETGATPIDVSAG